MFKPIFMTAFMMMLLVSMILYLVSMINTKIKFNKNFQETFECGFNPISLPMTPFSIQFFKILMLFLLFDLELVILLPSPIFHSMDSMNLISIVAIMTIMILGFIFEWKEGSIQWVN